MGKPFGLMRRTNGVFYWRPDATTWYRSTYLTKKCDALAYILEQLAVRKEEAARKAKAAAAVPLRAFLEPFYTEACPHVARLRAEKKQIGVQHVLHQRALLDRYILRDSIADKSLAELRRGDILDFRGRLLAKVSDSQANRVIGCLKTCLKEGVYRQEIEKDPTPGIGQIKHEKQERGIFTEEELKALFPKKGLGPWPDPRAYVCFLVAATVGLRRGELLALRWRDIDLDKNVVNILQAWKDDFTVGAPKWGKTRQAPLSALASGRLRELRAASLHVLPDALVFHESDGSRLTTRWWQDTFRAAMKKAKIDALARRITAHSFRHSLATLLRAAGQDPARIRAAMGWSEEKVQDGYTHWQIDHLRGQAELIDKILG